MDSTIAVKVEHLCKSYRLYNSPVDRLKESLHPLRRKYHHDFFALKDVSFEIAKGESVGIIGKNGSGKSTLLKVLSGVLTPTSGVAMVNGKVSALLELGSGFNPELTGVENVYFNGMLMGYSRQEMDERLDDILAFADIGEFVQQPVKTYSSGMFVRLAYAVAVSVEPDILIVDEALSVGDAVFQQRCVKKMEDFKNSGGNVIFVSHDLNAIKVLCQRAILMDKGRILEQGDADVVANLYNALIAQREDPSGVGRADKVFEHGNYKARIINVAMFNSRGDVAEVFVSGERITVSVMLEATVDLDDVVVGILIRDRFGRDIYGCNSGRLNPRLTMNAGGRTKFDYSIALSLASGFFSLTVAAHSGDTHLEDNYHWCDAAKGFEVVWGDVKFVGIASLETSLEVAVDAH